MFTKFIIVSYLIASAQVQVRDEPRHHNVFENEFIRILDVLLGPNDTTQYHVHNTPSVFIILTNSNVSSQLLGGQPQSGANVAGNISYDAMASPRTHRVWNEDTNWFHVMDIELTSKTQKSKPPLLQDPAIKLLFNEKEANGYMIDLKAGSAVRIPSSTVGYLLVSLETTSADIRINGHSQLRLLKPCHYVWLEEGKQMTLSVKNQSAGRFVLLQLK